VRRGNGGHAQEVAVCVGGVEQAVIKLNEGGGAAAASLFQRFSPVTAQAPGIVMSAVVSPSHLAPSPPPPSLTPVYHTFDCKVLTTPRVLLLLMCAAAASLFQRFSPAAQASPQAPVMAMSAVERSLPKAPFYGFAARYMQ
jgi:hypothetical protein